MFGRHNLTKSTQILLTLQGLQVGEFHQFLRCLEITGFYSATCRVRKASEIDLVHPNDTLETFAEQFLYILLHDEMRLGVWSPQPHRIPQILPTLPGLRMME